MLEVINVRSDDGGARGTLLGTQPASGSFSAYNCTGTVEPSGEQCEAMESPGVSVIMAVYNGEKYLEEAISSILGQTYRDFELIIVDDGSTDGTRAIIEEFLDDSRVVLLGNRFNQGKVCSRNRALAAAKSDLVAIMDADDVAMPRRLELQREFLNENQDVVLVGSHVRLIDEKGCFLANREVITGSENIRRVFFYYGPHRHPTVMFRKKVVQRLGGYRRYEYCQDIDLYFRLILSGYRTDNIPMYLLKYRVHPESSDRMFREKGRISFRIKKAAIRESGVSVGPVNILSMYVHYLLDLCLSVKGKRRVESLVKSVVDFVHQKRFGSHEA